MHLPQDLIEGYRAFRRGRLRREQDRFTAISPSTARRRRSMVIGCCDLRVSPEVIFDARPGELFVVRNVANLVPPYSPDEFASRRLGGARIRRAERCGSSTSWCLGTRAAAASRPSPRSAAPLSPGDFIGKWMSLIAPAAEKRSIARPAVRATILHIWNRPRSPTPRQSDDVSVRSQTNRKGQGRIPCAPISTCRPASSSVLDRANGQFVPVGAERRIWPRRSLRGRRFDRRRGCVCAGQFGLFMPPCASPGSACG